MKSDSRITCMNFISIFFLLLALLVCLVSAAWLTDTVAVPDSLSPKTPIMMPTLLGIPTLSQPTAEPAISEESPAETPIPTP